MSAIHRDTPKNGLLAAFSPEDGERFFSDLHPMSLSVQQVFYDTGAPLENVYFIEQGLASVLTKLTNGSMIGVGMIGMEGMVGVPVLLGDETSAQRVIVQVPGTALRMKAAPCKAAFDESAAVRRVLLRFAAARLNFSAQTAACNRVHSIKQRCARWLLMSSDRVQSDVMPMTHEFLSSMLGVRRTGVTTIAGELQRSGLIRYQRGQVTIIDHAGLEAAACECYRIDHARFEQRL
jgi:CRP-like cAMP-binding protein